MKCIKTQAWLTGFVFMLSGTTVSASNAILIESKIVEVNSVGNTVGVFIQNDVDLSALIIPLEIREMTAGSFVDSALSLSSAGRIASFESVGGALKYKRIYGCTGTFSRPHSCGGTTWNPADSGANFTTPDAILYAAVQQSDSVFRSGSDGSPGAGTPSLSITFGANGARGTFEIDTTCIAPHNHLLFAYGEFSQFQLVPTFTKGIVEIGGPFWDSDSISGHISDDLAIRGEVIVSGDLTIDSGVTLTLLRGSHLMAVSFDDDQSGGLDSERVEIIVDGTLAMDSYGVSRPMITGVSDSVGGWYGVRVLSGGQLESGIGLEIRDAFVAVRLDRSTIADTLSGVTIRNCDSLGINTARYNVALLHDSIFGLPTGTGIYIDSCGPLIRSCEIESCGTGIHTYKSWSTIRASKVSGPGEYGIRIDNFPISLQEGRWRGPKTPYSMATEGQYYHITLKCDTVRGYFATGQFWMGRNSSQCTVDSCGFIRPEGTTRSPYGMYFDWNDTVTVRNSSVTGFSAYGIYSNAAKVDLGVHTSSPGNNNISSDTAGCGSCGLKRVKHVGSDSLKAEDNWWGASSPSSGWFVGKVDYNPYLTSPASKVSSPENGDQVADGVPGTHVLAQNYPNPFNSATEIRFDLASTSRVEVKVYNILGQVIRTLVDSEFPEGAHTVTWHGTDQNDEPVASGVYLYQIIAGDFAQSKKMVLLK